MEENQMIETFCCALIALILRVLAGIYEVKFSFLGPLKWILLIAAIIFGVLTVILVVVNVVAEVQVQRDARARKKRRDEWSDL